MHQNTKADLLHVLGNKKVVSDSESKHIVFCRADQMFCLK